MALSGSFSKYPVSSFGLYCEWNATQNVIGNYSDVTLYVYLSYYTLEVGQRTDSYAQINGQSEQYTAPAIKDYSSGWKKKLLKTKTVRVYHDANGNASPSLGASWRFSGTYSGTYINWIEATSTAYLNQIDRSAPTISIATSGVTASSVYFSATASTTCDIWDYSIDGGNSWTTFSTTPGTSTSKTITGLSPNTSYSIRVAGRKQSNRVTGYSGTSSIKTLGGSVLSSVNNIAADASTASIMLKATVYDSNYSHTVKILNGSTVLVTLSGVSLSSGTSKTINFTAAQRTALLNAMPSVKTLAVTVQLLTYSGSSQIGTTSSKNISLTTSAANSAPVFNAFTYQDTNITSAGVTGNDQILIQTASRLTVTASAATAKNGASISSYQVTVGDKVASSTTTTIVVGAVNSTGTVPLVVMAIDSRGYTSSATVNVTVIAYEKINISSLVMRRINEVETTCELDISGSFSPVAIGGVNKNAFQSLTVWCKKTSETAYTQSGVISGVSTTSNSFDYSSAEFLLLTLDADYSYNILFRARDKLGYDDETVTIPQGTPLASLRRKKIGINNRNPSSALDVEGEIKQNGTYVLGYVGVIPSGDDFNNYKSGGIYRYKGAALQMLREREAYSK